MKMRQAAGDDRNHSLNFVTRLNAEEMPRAEPDHLDTETPRVMRFASRRLVTIVAVIVLVVRASTQVNPNFEQGLKPFGAYHGGDIDSISLTNGNQMVHLPLVSYPQRGDLSLSFSAEYNGKGAWWVKSWETPNPNPLPPTQHYQWHWGGSGLSVIWDQAKWVVTNPNTINGQDTADTYTINEASGAIHQLAAMQIPIATSFETIDASGLRWNYPSVSGTMGTIIDRHGTQFDAAVSSGSGTAANPWLTNITDRNGNRITHYTFSGGSPADYWIDTLGRTIPGLQGTTTSDFTSCPSGTSFANLWQPPGYSVGTMNLKFCYVTLTLTTNFNVSIQGVQVQEGSAAVRLMTGIVLPNGTTWTFSYSNNGDLTQITLPAGGNIQYGWENDTVCNTADPSTSISRWANSRSVDANDGKGAQTWHYKYQPGATTTVTDPLNNDTVHTITPVVPGAACSFYVTKTQWFQGPKDSGTLLKTVDTHYTGTTNPFSQSYGDGTQGANIVADQITTTWPKGKVSKTAKTYDSGAVYYMSNGPSAHTPSYPLVYGNVLQQNDYDFGSSTTPARQTLTSYKWQADANYLSANMLDLPSSTTTEDGAGNKCAETDYSYDDPARLKTSQITTQLVAVPGPVRGNLSSTSHWLSTAPCVLGATGSLITSYTNFYDTGELYQSIDPLGHTTTRTYATGFNSGTNFLGAYFTKTQNALLQSADVDYDFNTGLVMASRDANSNVTSSDYDSELRILHHHAPDGGLITWSYNDSVPPVVTVTTAVTASLNHVAEGDVDGLGRLAHSKLLSDPGGVDTTDLTYDAAGRPATTSNPHRSTASPTDGVTTSLYDALGRVTQVTLQDGGISSSDYSQFPTVTVTDPAGKQRRSVSDALGRLIEVDEPGAAYAGAPSSGTLTINGSLQSKPGGAATPGAGSVTLNGTEQSAQKVSSPATSGSASVTIGGGELSSTTCDVTCVTDWDFGTVTITVNGFSKTINYDQSSDKNSIASALVAAFNGDSTSPVTATLSGSTVNLYSKAAGASTNYSLSASAQSSPNSVFNPGTGFTATRSGANLTGGTNATYTTVYDSGACTVTVNGTPYPQNFGAGDSSAAIAQRLAGAVNGGSLASATASGSTISLTAKNGGVATNYSLSASCSYDSSDFSGPSFTAATSGSSLTGGTNAGPATIDSGTVTLNIGSMFSASACYGPSGSCASVTGCPSGDSTAAQVACVLGQGLSASSSPVTATISGSNISLVFTNPGQAGNVSVTVVSNPAQPSIFPGGSFGGSATLSGGADPIPSNLQNPYVTLYSHDALGNLLRVDQKGSAPTDSTKWRTRLFTYDSLGRLMTANNPESGTISYSYDADGNLLQKTSPAPNQTGSATQTISYCYDALHRVTGKAYSAQTCANGLLPSGTATVSYVYDQGTNGIGHVTSLADQAGSGSYTYDVVGRISTEQRKINGVTKTMSYGYNLDGSLKTLTYPSGATITYTPDSAGSNSSGRTGMVQDLGNNINYVVGPGGPGTFAGYGPDGGLTGFLSGASGSFAGITNSFSYNNRLQPAFMSAASPSQTVFSIGYDFHLGNGDNGNVYSLTNNRDHTRDQTFTYDALNRLTSAQNSGTDCTKTVLGGKTEYWGNSYGYDAWGNLLSKSVTKCSAENLSVTALTNNQLSGYGYDAPGNMTHDATSGLNYSYDAENRVTGAGGFTYTYDGDGNRVEKSNGSTGTLYWYMLPGIVAESDLLGNLQSEYVFFDGERVARKDFPSNAVSYYFSDHLKTASVITDSAGNIKSESDYYPWGGELSFTNNDSNHYKFTGKERDSETGLDYFGARYYSNGLGRFITPDWNPTPVPVPYADLGDPQSLNQYSYVRNIPTVKADADGHDGCCDTDIKVDMEMVKQTLQQLGPAAGPTLAAAGTVGLAVVDVVGVVVLVHELASPSTTVGQSNADERAAMQQAQHQREQQNRGVDPQTQGTEHAPEPQVSTSGAGATKGGGTIYRVPGSGTKSGKPYIGRHNKPNPAETRKSKDGRDRTRAEVVDTYDATNTQEGRTKEQQQIDQNGGVQNLDNQRNEIRKPKDQ